MEFKPITETQEHKKREEKRKEKVGVMGRSIIIKKTKLGWETQWRERNIYYTYTPFYINEMIIV